MVSIQCSTLFRVGPTRTSLETEHVDANILQVAEPFFKELNVHKASKNAEEVSSTAVLHPVVYHDSSWGLQFLYSLCDIVVVVHGPFM